MQSFFHKTKGAISIFLIIILVPMMTLSGIVVDMGRMRLANSVAASAGDLALNTALSQYNNVLKEMYGLFSISQNNEELMSNLETYFERSINSAGYEGDDADLLLEQIMGNLTEAGSGNATSADDLLKMDMNSFDIVTMNDSSLGNPALLKGQIVNFMKYRAPINTGLNLVNALKSMQTMDEQMNLVEKKNNYYKEYQSIVVSCQSAWNALANYNNLKLNETDIKQISERFTAFGGDYKLINQYLVKDLYNYSAELYNVMDVRALNVNTSASLNELSSAIDKAEAVINSDFYQDKFTQWNNAGAYKSQIIVQMNIDGSIPEAFRDLQQSYQGCENTLDDLRDDASEEEDEARKEALQTKAEEFASNLDPLRQQYSELMGTYEAVASGMLSYYNSNRNQLKDALASSNSKINGVDGVYTVANDFHNRLTKAYSVDPSTGMEQGYLIEAKAALVTIRDALAADGSLTKAKNEWQTAASNDQLKGDPLAEQNIAEIEQLAKYFTSEDATSLMDRISKAIDSIIILEKEVDTYSYADKKLYELSTAIDSTQSIETALSAKGYGTQLDMPSVNESELDGLASTIYTAEWKAGDSITSSWSDQETSPQLDKNMRRFYVYLKQNFEKTETASTKTGYSEQDTKAQKDKLDNTKKTLNTYTTTNTEEAKEDAGDTVNSMKEVDFTELPSDQWAKLHQVLGASKTVEIPADADKAADNVGKQFTNLFANFSDAVKDVGIRLRDSIYISDYVMGMFSYDTYENEILWELDGRKNGLDEVSNIVKSAKLYNQSGDEYTLSTTVAGIDMAKYEEKAKSLTKEAIDPNNNYLYKGEVEYILYGFKDSTANKAAAYATIFAIRFASNTVYAFLDPEIRNTAWSIASATFAAPPLTLLIPVAAVALIMGISLAESSIDILCLKAGMAVPLFKTKSSWRLSMSGMLQTLKDTAIGLTMDAVDYGLAKLNDYMDITDEELNNKLDDASDTLSQELTDGFDELMDQSAGMAVTKLTDLCTEANQLALYTAGLTENAGDLYGSEGANEITPLTKEERVGYIKDKLKEWLVSEAKGIDTASDMAYSAKEAAVNVILNSGDQYIEQFLDMLDQGSTAKDIISDQYYQLVGKINNKITEAISTGSDKIKELKTKAIGELKTAAKKGADEFKKVLSEKLTNSAGKSVSASTAVKDSALGTVFSFQYSDYLQLLLIITLSLNEETILVRTADMIQMNIRQQSNGEGFAMTKAYTYLEIDSDITVKPLLMDIPLLNEFVGDLTGKEWNVIHYKGIAGY